MAKKKQKAAHPHVSLDASQWTGLWAMDQLSLRNLASGTPQEQQEQPDYTVLDGMAVIPIVGPIAKYPSLLMSGVSTLEVQSQLSAALDDGNIERIILYIDSPGGTVAGTSDLANLIASGKQIKPIIAYISDHCFSAAYWIASQCTSIVANEGAFVGSIGVYSVLTDTSKAAESMGVSLTLIAAGEFKGLEEPGIPIDQKAVGEAFRQVNDAYSLFTSAVSTGRNLSAQTVKQLADGRIHLARDAQSLNLLDAIGTLAVAQTIGVTMEDKKIDPTAVAVVPVVKAEDDNDAKYQAVLDGLKQCLAAIQSLSAKDDEDDDEDEDDDDDNDAKKAVAAEKARLSAIKEACGNRADLAIKAYLEGKSAIEAKASLVDILESENQKLRKAAGDSVVEPLAIAGAAPANTNDPEVIWSQNIGDVQTIHSGRKEFFLANWKYDNKQKLGVK